LSDPIADNLIARLADCGVDEKSSRILIHLASNSPLKASEVGKDLQLSRMDAYNTLRRLQERGLVSSTIDKPARFAGMTIEEVFKRLIKLEEQNLNSIKNHLDEIEESGNLAFYSEHRTHEDSSFTVIKNRTNIMGTADSLISEAEVEIWLLLGDWGIMHMMRSGIHQSLIDAIARGVDVRVISRVRSETIRFYDDLDDGIDIRHHDALSLQGFFVDGRCGLQLIDLEDNPTGRGRTDSALLIESEAMLSAQVELIKVKWASATSFRVMRSRVRDGMMTGPLRVTLGEGSFYQRLREVLSKEVGQEDVGWTNAILRRSGEKVVNPQGQDTLGAMGINLSEILKPLGKRIGSELALEMRDIEDDEEFWTSVARVWKDLGMGEMIFEGIPPKSINVQNSNSCGYDSNRGMLFCHLDEGVIEGLMEERHGKFTTVVERECTVDDDDNCFFEISPEPKTVV